MKLFNFKKPQSSKPKELTASEIRLMAVESVIKTGVTRVDDIISGAEQLKSYIFTGAIRMSVPKKPEPIIHKDSQLIVVPPRKNTKRHMKTWKKGFVNEIYRYSKYDPNWSISWKVFFILKEAGKPLSTVEIFEALEMKDPIYANSETRDNVMGDISASLTKGWSKNYLIRTRIGKTNYHALKR